MRGLVILLLLPLFLGDSTPELVSDFSETRPTCEYDSDCRSGYNCCIFNQCRFRLSCCHYHRDCSTNCCYGNTCMGSSICDFCFSSSDCYETNCCKDNLCVDSSECSLSPLATFIIVAVVVIIASAAIVFGCTRGRRRYASMYRPPPPYVPPPVYSYPY